MPLRSEPNRIYSQLGEAAVRQCRVPHYDSVSCVTLPSWSTPISSILFPTLAVKNTRRPSVDQTGMSLLAL